MRYDKIIVRVIRVASDHYQVTATGIRGKSSEHLGGNDVTGARARGRANELACAAAADLGELARDVVAATA